MSKTENKLTLPTIKSNFAEVKKNIAIFASGAGSNAAKIMAYFKSSELARVALVISNKKEAGVLKIARDENIPTLMINREKLNDSPSLLEKLALKKIDFIVLAGFLLKIPEFLIREFPDKIINIHPALLPKYGGKGMYGRHVHAAVLAGGDEESGITIHYINENYDEGKIILQKRCMVDKSDDAESLALKIQKLEHQWFPVAIEKIIKEDIEK